MVLFSTQLAAARVRLGKIPGNFPFGREITAEASRAVPPVHLTD
jgi:hypothetical protein